MNELSLQCQCGKIQGKVQSVKPTTSNRVICYCKDCQAFAQVLARESDVLNKFGGTDIVQFPPSLIHIDQGTEHIRCLRLSEKGLHRWYAGCCNTPIGNTVSASWPFIGVINSFIASAQDTDAILGPVLGSVHLNGASGRVPNEIKGPGSVLKVTLSLLKKLIVWKVKGMGSPSPLYQADGKPIVTPRIVPSDSKVN